ncbi:MAG: fructosamine kinase family protein [Ignavibacteriae bacterium]|nr:fructosamine kinase family protein [Ignavibacteriota bacterium]
MKSKLENILKEKIISANSIGGGCIANAQKITTESGNLYFVKQYSKSEIHRTEANGLKELAKANAIRIPQVIHHDDSILVLEYIQSANQVKNFSVIFGRQFAELHKYTSDKFGFYEDNFCGSTTQKNLPQKSNWAEFYLENRLLFQYKLAEQNGYVSPEMQHTFHHLEKEIHNIIGGSEEEPSLLHGDLWSGNYMTDEKGMPCLIDPAVYYGHREADLAMTKLFGNFGSTFYSSYQETFPLHEGWEFRENIYKLYHIFNHLNIFGEGYYSQVIDLMESYT